MQTETQSRPVVMSKRNRMRTDVLQVLQAALNGVYIQQLLLYNATRVERTSADCAAGNA